ncbi:MAG: hypothetical protein JSS66_05475 [Armatimonadetes bacterium]|nr:hypothetical protein [Armatimonadota bacterium]
MGVPVRLEPGVPLGPYLYVIEYEHNIQFGFGALPVNTNIVFACSFGERCEVLLIDAEYVKYVQEWDGDWEQITTFLGHQFGMVGLRVCGRIVRDNMPDKVAQEQHCISALDKVLEEAEY